METSNKDPILSGRTENYLYFSLKLPLDNIFLLSAISTYILSAVVISYLKSRSLMSALSMDPVLATHKHLSCRF